MLSLIFIGLDAYNINTNSFKYFDGTPACYKQK